ncbi:RCC1 domain-containing protein [Paenibacillus aurantiacus]|uniref:RCC1 domain-containing protein n=1 Tax=Paenibacillus aurantiacus TaxID=1936118 RepID=A0ABV5KZV6_9BACL
MGSKFGSIHIRTEEVIDETSILTASLMNPQISNFSSGWTSLFSESLQWGSTIAEAKRLSRKINFPILSVEYFDDDVMEIHLMQVGKKVASCIQGTALEGYGLKRKQFNTDKIYEVLGIELNAKELEWISKELDLWDLCDYLQVHFNLPFRPETQVDLLPAPQTPWNTNISPQPKGKTKEKKYEAAILRPGSLTMAMVTKEGELYTWGNKSYGVLGDASIQNRKKPVKILERIVEVSMGSYSAYAINDSGELIGWGEHSPHGTSIPQRLPLNDVKDVGIRARDAYFLLSSGKLYSYGLTWNSDDFICLRKDVQRIHVTEYDAFAITQTGELYGFGQNAYGQLGDLTDGKSNCILKNVKTIDSDGYAVHAIMENGDLYLWRGAPRGGILDQQPVKEFTHVVQAVQAYNFVYAITENRDLYAWGTSDAYVGGSDRYFKEKYEPTKILEKVKKVVRTTYRIFVLFQTGEVCSFFVNHDQPGEDGYYTSKHASPLYRLGTENRTFSGDKKSIEGLQKTRLHMPKTEMDFVPEIHLNDVRAEDIVATQSECYAIDSTGHVWVLAESFSANGFMKIKKPVRLKIQVAE